MNRSLKARILSFILLMFVWACEKEDNFSVENLYNLKIWDPYGTYPLIEPVNDTICYLFQPNGEMLKTGRNYSIKSGSTELVSIDTLRYVYWMDKDFLYWHLHPNEYGKLLPMFGMDNGQWEILKLNSDTMIVNLYNGKDKIGHRGFKVLN